MRLNVDTVHRRLDPLGMDRAAYEKSKQDAMNRRGSDENILMSALNKMLGTDHPTWDQDSGEQEEIIDLDPLGRALATLLVEKKILTRDEIEKALDDILDEDDDE